jgi:hypothetical protein
LLRRKIDPREQEQHVKKTSSTMPVVSALAFAAPAVRAGNARVVRLDATSGREFFDAVVPTETIDPVLVRAQP